MSAHGRDVTIVNRSARPLRHAVVRIGARCGIVPELPVGVTRTVADKDCAELKPPGGDSWPSAVMMNIHGEVPARESFVLVAETDETVPAVEAKPVVRTGGSDVVIVRGPLSDAGATP